MKLSENLFSGFGAIFSNKTRSLLTMLGIVIGVASVLAMISVGDGAKAIVIGEAEKLGGANQFSLYRSRHIRKGNRWSPNRSNEYFTYDDVLAIEAEAESVDLVVPRIPVWGGALVLADGGAEMRCGYYGITPTYQIGMDWALISGRFITDEDLETSSLVCVIGSEVAEGLFGDEEPIGKELKIIRGGGYGVGRRTGRGAVRLKIVGVMTQRGTSLRFGWNLDDDVLLPLTTMQERFTGNDQITMLSIYSKDVDLVNQSADEVKAIISRLHRTDDEFYNVWFMMEGMKELDRISKVIKISLGGIAGFSLLVGGIGIMNMMLVSVTERTREIGLRKAIGAKKRDIAFQFLSEAIIICTIGGLVGVGLGIGIGYFASQIATKLVTMIEQWPFVIPTNWIAISVAFSATIGIFFGLYPAIRAAQLQPIEALRVE